MTPDTQPALSLVHRVIPPRQTSSNRPPGLLLLHGRGADELDLLGLAHSLDPRFLMVSARAPFPLGAGYHWYDLRAVGEPEPSGFAQPRGLLETFLTELPEAYGLDADALFLLGFSQGAMMSGALTLTQPRRVAGAVLLSGYLPLRSGLTIDPAGLVGQPIFVAHGQLDDVIPVQFGREARDYLTQAKAALTYREYPIGHQIGPETLRDLAAWLSDRLNERETKG